MNFLKIATKSRAAFFVYVTVTLLFGQFAFAADAPIKVNVDNFVRAETDIQIGRILKLTGGVNKLAHFRKPTPLDAQLVIRMNRDTLYSAALVDISEGATVTLPNVGERYLSMMVVNQDGYINKVFHGGGTYTLTTKEFDTPYVVISMRILVNSASQKEIKLVNSLQDKMKVEAASAKPYDMPNYDMNSYKVTYNALLELAKGIPDAKKSFGKKEDVDPVHFLTGAAFGWGGLPAEEASYLNVEPNLSVGKYNISVKDVPVNAFWSISVYNSKGFFQQNDRNAYSVNNISGIRNKDGSIKVHFGGCDDDRVNCLPIMDGWNYTVRLYQPRKEILDGTWTFPKVQMVE